MDEFIGGIGAEEFADFGGAEALEETDLGAGILGEALGDPAAGEVMDVDEVAGGEIAGDGADADGQEAFAAQEKGVAGAIIDGEGSLGVVEEGDPAAAVVQGTVGIGGGGGAGDEGADVGAGGDGLENVLGASVGNDDGGSHPGGLGGGGQLAGHAAGGKNAALALGVG